jgi:hypothetical protein
MIILDGVFMKDFVKKCKKHGNLKKEQTMNTKYIGVKGTYIYLKCKICESESQKNKYRKNPEETKLTHRSRAKYLAVDHCHKTGKIRGLLCHYCNIALGGFKDSIESLKKAIKYLEGSI